MLPRPKVVPSMHSAEASDNHNLHTSQSVCAYYVGCWRDTHSWRFILMIPSATEHNGDLIPIRDLHRTEVGCRNRFVVYDHKPPPGIRVCALFIELLLCPLHNEGIQSINVPGIFSFIDTYRLWGSCVCRSELRAATLTLRSVAVRFLLYGQPKQLSALVRTLKTQGSIIDATDYIQRRGCGPRSFLRCVLRKRLTIAIYTLHKVFALVT